MLRELRQILYLIRRLWLMEILAGQQRSANGDLGRHHHHLLFLDLKI